MQKYVKIIEPFRIKTVFDRKSNIATVVRFFNMI